MWVVLGGPALSAPIAIRARTSVTLEHRRTAEGLAITCRLVDDLRHPLPRETVSFELPDRPPEILTTDADGTISLLLDKAALSALERAHRHVVPWTLRYAGTRRFGEALAEGRLDLSRAPSRLRLTLPDQAPIVSPDAPITLDVALEDLDPTRPPGPLSGAAILVTVGTGRELSGTTGSTGRVSFIVPPDLVATGGRFVVAARFLGTALHTPSEDTLTLTVLRPTRLTLRVVREGEGAHARYRFSGRLADQDGPVAGHVVALAIADTPAFQPLALATDPNGLYVGAIDESELRTMKLDRAAFSARFEPPPGLYARAASPPVTLELPAPPGIPVAWYLAVFLIGGLAFTLVHTFRTGLLRRALASLRALQGPLKPARQAPVPPLPAPSSAPGLAGQVVDRHTRAPLRASITTPTARLQCDQDGCFTLREATPLELAVSAPGYLPRTLTVATSTHLAIELVSVAAEVRSTYLQAVAALGTPTVWGRETPRESAARLAARAPLGELVAIVEAVHFGAEMPTPRQAEQAHRLATSLTAAER